MKAYIGIDLGGTFIKYGVINESGKAIGNNKVATPKGCNYSETIKEIAGIVNDLASKENLTDGIGVGVPGVIDSDRGMVLTSGNLKWTNKPFAKDLSKLLKTSVVLVNDANAAAYGEYTCGAGMQFRSIVLITIGTGIGSGIVLAGKMYSGTNGAGAELGHEVIRFGGEKCTCGRRGCFEAYASVTALIRQTKRAMEKDRTSILWQLCDGDLENLNGKIPFDGKLAGDKTAAKVVNAYIRYLAEGMANIANTFRPEAILIGGGMSAQGEALTVPLQKKVNSLMLGHGKYAPVKIHTAMLGKDAGLVGAAMLAKEKRR